MKNHKRKLKAIALSLALAAMMLPASVSAQELVDETGGGMFGLGKLFETDELFDNLIEEEPTEIWMPESGGLFNSYESGNADNTFLGNRGLFNINIPGNTDTGITNQGIGEAPLGSGLLILLGAGLGYVALKKKED